MSGAGVDRRLLSRLWSYVRPHRGLLLLAVVFMGLVSATEAAIPAMMKPLLDHGFANPDPNGVWLVPAAIVGLALVRGIAQFTSGYLLNRASNNVLLALRESMFARLLHAPASLFGRRTKSELINAIVFEVNQVLQVLSGTMITLVRDSLNVVFLLGYLLYLNWRLTLVVAIVLPLIGLLMANVSRRLRSLNRKHQEMTNSLSYVVEEVAAGYKVVKIHGGEAYEQRRFLEKARTLRAYAMRMAVAAGLNQPITQLLASVALSVILVIALLQTSSQQTTVGGFAAFITAMLLIVSPLKHLADVNQPLQRGLSAAEMIFDLIDQPLEAEALSGTGSEPMVRARGEIDFAGVGFAYPGSERAVLAQIDLHVKPGQVLALVGASGSGKTTLVNLLPRFLEPVSGEVRIDGVPINGIRLADLRRQIAMVSQDVVLFNDTVAANVAYGTTIDRARVAAALDAAYLGSTVAALPDGMDTLIGDNGSQLSGGQRQRLAIARALYKDAPILILDEATSALDSESERQVQAALERLMRDRTTLVIAHRLSTIEQADEIVVLDQGRIVERGNHASLLARGGLYAGLCRLQFGAGSNT